MPRPAPMRTRSPIAMTATASAKAGWIARHLLSVAILPFVMAVIVPRWLAAWPGDTRWSGGVAWIGRAAGAMVFLAGLGLFAWCLALFARVGRGTLAPWDPPTRLVAVGPYRHVRNPMISGVMGMIGGQALFLGSRALAVWVAAFLAINQLYFMAMEEPGLEARFGAEYRRYRAAVPRWIPRLRPWDGG